MSNILNYLYFKKSKNTVHFLDTVTVYETYSGEEYDRTNTDTDTNTNTDTDTDTDIQCLEIQTDATLLENWWTRLLNNINFGLNYLKVHK